MTRPLAVAALFLLPAFASAQVDNSVPPGFKVTYGPPEVGGRRINGPAIADASVALFPVQTPTPRRFGIGGGSMGAYPQVWVPSGTWGGVSYQWPVTPIILEPIPAPAPTAPPRSTTVFPLLSTSSPTKATLVVQFPAAAEVWLDGKKGTGDKATEWTLTSEAMKTGESHTFEVKATWTESGKTFEVSQSLTVAAGDRNRSIILNGNEIRSSSDATARK